MEITYVRGKITGVVGCRIHAENEDCRGDLLKAKSIYGAVVEICEKAFEKFDKTLWTRMTP